MLTSEIYRGKKILIGVTGGIAAYKTCEFIRFLVTAGAEVKVMMTRAALEFITPLTLETLSQNPVYREMFPDDTFTATHHVHLADWADVAVIAPATANIIGKLAAGIADDFVTSTWLALNCPKMIAPAMNSNMWKNPIVRRNVETLKTASNWICPPETGFLAEGYVGEGRFACLDHLVQHLYRALHSKPKQLAGKKVLITAGRTEEPLDPVRFLTNHSSGKMGCALAVEAFARGAKVVLVHGPMDIDPPGGIVSIAVENASEMANVVLERFGTADIYISAAAIADYRPAKSSDHKIKKNNELVVALEKTTDILNEVGKKRRPGQLLLGFAMETENGEENALKKLNRKKLDGIVLNLIGDSDSAFRNDYNQVTLFSREGTKSVLDRALKLDIARRIFDFYLTQ